MDDINDSQAPSGLTADQLKAYASNPGVAADALAAHVRGAYADMNQAGVDLKDRAVSRTSGAAPGSDAYTQAANTYDQDMSMNQGAAMSVGSISTALPKAAVFEKVLASPEAQMALQKMQLNGAAPSAALAEIYRQATGRIIPVAEKTGLGVPRYAEGGDVPAPAADADFIPDHAFESDEDHYSTPEQLGKTALEGVAHGLAGPIATAVEQSVGIKSKDILGRQEANPITQGVGQAAGLGIGMMTGTGEAALMSKAGEGALELAGMARTAEQLKASSYGFKVGSAAVQQAAEMAVLQGTDEVSKMMMKDPKTSAESAMANVGLSALLGGAGGALVTGVVSPLWSATAGPKLESALSAVKNHLDGKGLRMSEAAEQAAKTLGIDIDPVTRAGLSGAEAGSESYKILREGQNRQVTEGLANLERGASEAVSGSLGILPEEIAVRDENTAGHELLETFKKEYDQKYAPIAEAMEKRNAEAANISITDDARLKKYGQMIEEGMNKVGTDSPAYKLYNDWGNRLLAKETIGGIDQLKTELNSQIGMAVRSADNHSLGVLRDIRSSLADFQESQIAKQATSLEKAGVDGARKSAADLINERAQTNRSYADFAKMSGELTDHLGVGGFKGAKTLTNKLTDGVTAEQLLNKFSFKGNQDFLPFLQQHFPEVLQQVKDNELKRFLKPAVLGAKGDSPINIKKLADLVEKTAAGNKGYLDAIMPQGALERISAARDLMDAIPGHKSSGTAGWMTKMYKGAPASAMAGVGMLTGHSPIWGAIIGHASELMGRDIPDQMRLGYLKFLASDQPIKAEGFKAMVDYMHAVTKGETALNTAAKNVFKAGAEVLAASARPSEADREKLDRQVVAFQDHPEILLQREQGHLGHYLPDHQTQMTAASTGALQYLQTLKPHSVQLSPLDRSIPPTPAQENRYHRALDIANNPTVVLDHIKRGTIQPTDITDLKSMYPAVYLNMTQKLSNQMTAQQHSEDHIPYTTRLGMSLFLGQPVDSTMTPGSIVAAQPKANQTPQQPQTGAKVTQKGGQALGKMAKGYQTTGQSAEADRSGRD